VLQHLTPSSVASFLRTAPGLNDEAIGKYLGEVGQPEVRYLMCMRHRVKGQGVCSTKSKGKGPFEMQHRIKPNPACTDRPVACQVHPETGKETYLADTVKRCSRRDTPIQDYVLVPHTLGMS
jgi:hypothetical protein